MMTSMADDDGQERGEQEKRRGSPRGGTGGEKKTWEWKIQIFRNLIVIQLCYLSGHLTHYDESSR